MKKNKKQKDNQVIFEDEEIPKHAFSTIKRLLKYLLPQKKKMFVIIVSGLLSSLSFALIPLFVALAIDGLVEGIPSLTGSSQILGMLKDVLIVPVGLLILTSIVCSTLSYLQQYIVASVGEELTLSLRMDVSDKLTKLPLRFFDKHKTGEVLSRVTNDLEKVSEVMQVGLMQFISSVFTIIIVLVTMVLLNPMLTLIVVGSTLLGAFATVIVSGKSQLYFAQNQSALGNLNSRVEELYSGNMVLKVFNQQEIVIDSLMELNDKQFKTMRKAQFAMYAIYPALRLLNQLGFVVTALCGGFLAIQGQLSIGMVQAFLQYVNQIGEPITNAAYVVNSLQAAIAGAERVFEILDEEEEIADIQNTEVNAIQQGCVEFQHVRFGYSPNQLLMKDLSLMVKPNEMVAIVGPTGGGKTTLVNLLMRFYELNGGKITIDGVDITKIPRGQLRRKIGMVLQDTWLFKGTIAQNIAYGKQDSTREEIIEAAKAARCDHFIRTLPLGYDTIIHGESAQVSQGQLQLLTIARAMLANPSIMILDEATSSVDTRTEVEIQKAMSHIMQGKTSFVIAHRLSTIINADQILVVKEGDIIETGTHQTLLAKNGFYASLYNSQFS